MATIGLKNVHVASRTVSKSEGNTSVAFGTPVSLAPAISANIDIEYAEGSLAADDGTLYNKKVFKKGKITLNTDDLPVSFLTNYLGSRVAANGMIVDSAEDQQIECAVGFQSLKANGADRYVWLPRVVFAIPSDAYTTKGDSITFNTPTIEGTIMEEIIEDSAHRHHWRYRLDSDSTATGAAAAAAAWFNAVPTVSTITFS